MKIPCRFARGAMGGAHVHDAYSQTDTQCESEGQE